MPVNKDALLRYRIIDSCLRKKYNRYITLEQLQQECYELLGTEVSERTIKSDLNAMRHDEVLGYLAPIEYSHAHRGYFYTDQSYSIEKLPFTEADTQAVLFAVNMLSRFRGVPLLQQFQGAVDKLFNAMQSSRKLSKEESHVVEMESSPEAKGGEWLSELISAIINREAIGLTYQSFNRDEPVHYALHPYLLKEYRNRWYLLAFDEEKAKIKTFGLDRIVHLERSERHFQLSPNFKPSDYFKYSYGITYSEQAPMEVHLSFYGPSCHYVLTKPLHPSQQIISQSPDSLEVKLKVLHSYELLADILSFGDACQVLGPSQLKKEVKTILEKALRKY